MRAEDKLYMQIVKWMKMQHPNIVYHFDTGTGGTYSIGMAVRNAKLNPFKGYPDFFIPAKVGNYSGLFLELKTEGIKIYLKDGKTLRSDSHLREQSDMLSYLTEQGYYADFAVGLDDAIFKINNYLKS